MTNLSAPPAAPSAAQPAPKASPFASKAPARPGLSAIGVGTLGSVAALVALVAIGVALHQIVLIPPLAASAALVFGAPALPLSQPRSVIGGQLISALVGFVVLAVAGHSMWAAGVAGGLALGAMMLARTPHSPAAATAVIVVLTQPHTVKFLALLALATVVLVVVGIVAGRSGRTARYPSYWW
ncbi:HPP family protein [Kitasatospora albolonga]|uniref:HPP family protein n=1 Tax=Kitasatospora albolonga TaxID=68173 RepID=UPI0031EB11BB